MNHLLIPPKVNIALTRRVIALHNQGYISDFSVTADYRILCIQDQQLFTIDQVWIKLVDLCFDEINSCHKYIHIVETCCGAKGLLVDCCPCVNALLAGKVRISPVLNNPQATGITTLL